MSKSIYILGAGGHAKILLECLQKNTEIKISGFLEIDEKLIGQSIFGVPIYEQNKKLAEFYPNSIMLANGIGSTDLPNLRRKQFEIFKKQGYEFCSLIHPTCYYSHDVIIEEGAQLLARSTILTGTRIGYNTIVNTSASIDHDCDIGNHVHIAPGVVLSGGVKIGDNCHVGTGANIIQGIKIGENSLIAAGAVVISDVASNSRVAGVPAKSF